MYEQLVARMKRCGWKVEYKQVALGTRWSVYIHLTHPHVVGSTKLQNEEEHGKGLHSTARRAGGIEGTAHVRVVVANGRTREVNV